MKEMYSGEQAKAIDTHAIDTMGMPSLVLMEKAAMSVVSVLLEKAGPYRRISGKRQRIIKQPDSRNRTPPPESFVRRAQ